MEIERKKNRFNAYDYCLTDEDKVLTILFAGNLDLYLMINDNELIKYMENKTIHFDITKKDYDIFSLFDTMYNNIIKCKILDIESIKTNYRYQYNKLVDDNKNINWISDEDLEEIGDSFKLSKLNNDEYRLTFYRNGKIPSFGFKSPTHISVRIRNSGSRYDPFNCAFMQMYNELQNIDSNYRQICFEEIEYTKKLSRKRR